MFVNAEDGERITNTSLKCFSARGVWDFAHSVRHDAITEPTRHLTRSEGNERIRDEGSASVLMGFSGPSAGPLLRLRAAPRPSAAGAPLTDRAPPGLRPHAQRSQCGEFRQHD